MNFSGVITIDKRISMQKAKVKEIKSQSHRVYTKLEGA